MSEIKTAATFSVAEPVTPPGHTTVGRSLLRFLVQERNILLCEALRILGTQDRAEDVLQDTALRCLSSRTVGEMKDLPDNPRGFLRQMVHNLALDHYRKQRREMPCDAAAVAEDLACPAASVEQSLAARQELSHLCRALGTLSPNRRHAFVESRLKERRQTEIATEMNLSPARVHALIQSAQSQLADAMEDW